MKLYETVLALNLGADDCVEEPLEISEVVAALKGSCDGCLFAGRWMFIVFAAICIDTLMLFSFQAQLIWLVGPRLPGNNESAGKLPSALSEGDCFARCTLGVLVAAGAAICLAPCGSTLGELNLGQAINAVTRTRLWAF